MNQLLQLPVTLEKFQSMSKGAIRLVFDTQEAVSQEAKAKIIESHEQFGWLTFLVGQNQIKPEDVINLPEEKKEFKDEKTPSQILRNRMFVYYKEKKNTTEGFDEWRKKELERLGQQYLSKMN